MNCYKPLLILPGLAVSLILLAGCQSRAAQTQTVLPLSSPAVVATATQSPIPREATETGMPVIPPPLEPRTLAPTPTPHILPTAGTADLPLPTLPSLPGDASDYRLTTPSPDQLLALMTAARQQMLLVNGIDATGEWDQEQDDRWSWLSPGVLKETDAFAAAVEGAFLQAYPTALPDPSIVFQDPYAKWWISYPFLRPYPPRYVADGFLSQLNQDGYQVEVEKSIDISYFSLVPYPAELDGTPGPEWIFEILPPSMDVRYNGFALWQAVDELPGPKYAPLGNPILAQPYLWPKTYQVTDLTGDGRTDLIVTGTGAGAGNVRKDFIAYQWTPAGFKQMSHIVHWAVAGAEELTPESYIKFFPEMPPALRVVSDANHAWGCVYKTMDVYRWPGGIEQRVETNTMKPDAPDCLLADATSIYSSDRIDIDATQHMLERALAGFDPNDPKDQAKISFAHYHLAIIEAIRENDTAARLHLRNVIQGFASDVLTTQHLNNTLVPLLAKPRLRAMELCSVGNSAPEDVFGVWRSGLNYPFGFGMQTSENLCFHYDVANRVMQHLPVGSPDSPELPLKAAWLGPGAIQPLQFPGLKQPVWLTTISDNPNYQTLIGSIPTEKGIEWTRLESYYQTSGPSIWLNSDVTGDGAADLAVALPTWNKGDCQANEQRYEVFIAGRIAAQDNVYGSSTIPVCQPDQQPIDLKALMADQDGDGLADRLLQEVETERKDNNALGLPDWPDHTPIWYTAADLSKTFRTLAGQEAELLTALYHHGNPSETRARLLVLRQALRPGPPGQNTRQQIDYLIALSYELEGQSEQAVQRYLALAQETPQTLWSNLAADKIVRK